MPRAVFASTTFVFAASTSCLFATLASAGPVPIGAYDVVPNDSTADAQALRNEVVAGKQRSFSIEDRAMGETLLADTVEQGGAIPFFVPANPTSFDGTGIFALKPLADEPSRFTSGRVGTSVADGFDRAVVLSGPISVPLPGAVWTSIIGLAGVAWLKRRGIKG